MWDSLEVGELLPDSVFSLLVGGAFLAMTVVVVRLAFATPRGGRWMILLGVFAAVRAADNLIVGYLGYEPLSVRVAVDLATLAVLLAMTFAVARVGLIVEVARSGAARERQQHEANRRYYEQVLRHRLANPLTVLLGGLQTLYHVDLDKKTRCALIEEMMQQAHALEHVMLDPQPLDELEQEYYDQELSGTDPV